MQLQQQQDWRKRIEQQHSKFTFSAQPEAPPTVPKKHSEPFESTSDSFLRTIKKVMLAEGDTLGAGH
jgi:hypothetical protein